eukprot:COSAG04_NODE_104_length_26097_cov_12.466074_11_plen_517_part_00
MPSRSEIIAQLKSRGTKGKLSKMKKAELQELLHRTAPPQLELEPDEQSGNGKGTYKEFMKAHLKQHGGNMSKAAAAYRDAKAQKGGHYFRKDGKTVSKGSHTHEDNPWPADGPVKVDDEVTLNPRRRKKKAVASKDEATPAEKRAAKSLSALLDKDNATAAEKRAAKSLSALLDKPAPKKKKKKKRDPIEDPDADITVDLVNRRLNADRHPSTGRKISGKKASEMQFLLMQSKPSRLMDGDRVTAEDVEQRLDNIDKEHAKEFPNRKKKHGNVDVANIIREGERKREKPKYLGMKGGHYARADGSVRPSDNEKYDHEHKPAKNPAQAGKGFWEEMLHPDSSSAENHGEFFLNLAQNIDDHLQGKQTNWSDLMPTSDTGLGATVDAGLLALAPGLGEAAEGSMGSVLAAGEKAEAAGADAIRTSKGLVDAEGAVVDSPYQAMGKQLKTNVKKGIAGPVVALAGEEGIKDALGRPEEASLNPFPAGAAQVQSNYAQSARAFAMANTQPFATSGINPWG